jgi:hypothetical protein
MAMTRAGTLVIQVTRAAVVIGAAAAAAILAVVILVVGILEGIEPDWYLNGRPGSQRLPGLVFSEVTAGGFKSLAVP